MKYGKYGRASEAEERINYLNIILRHRNAVLSDQNMKAPDCYLTRTFPVMLERNADQRGRKLKKKPHIK